jgi:hypothetical protein
MSKNQKRLFIINKKKTIVDQTKIACMSIFVYIPHTAFFVRLSSRRASSGSVWLSFIVKSLSPSAGYLKRFAAELACGQAIRASSSPPHPSVAPG